MIFNMMSYGGAGYGDADDAYAVWRVSYPAGSTCTCTKDDDTLEAPDTSGSVFFYIPEAGSWRVECTDGTKTASATVTFNTSTRIKATTLSYEVDPGPTPTPTETKIVAFSNSYSGALACMQNGGSGYTDGPYQGSSYTFVVPEAGSYLITFIYSVGGAAQTKQYFVDVTEGQTKRVNMDSGAITTDGSSDSGSDTPTPTPSSQYGTVILRASRTGYFNIDDGTGRDTGELTTSRTFENVPPGEWYASFVPVSGSSIGQATVQLITVTAGEESTYWF